MKLHIRKQTIKKCVFYSLVMLLAILFSSSFLPALRITNIVPNLLVTIIIALARFEDIRYSSMLAMIFGVVWECVIKDTRTLLPLFFVALSIGCTYLFDNFLVRNFFSWFLYTIGGLVLLELFTIFTLVSRWDASITHVIIFPIIPEFLLSVALSIPLYPLIMKIQKVTSKSTF